MLDQIAQKWNGVSNLAKLAIILLAAFSVGAGVDRAVGQHLDLPARMTTAETALAGMSGSAGRITDMETWKRQAERQLDFLVCSRIAEDESRDPAACRIILKRPEAYLPE